MKAYIISALLLFTLSVSSCKKFLDEKADKRLIVPKTIEDLQGLLDDSYIMNTQTPSFGEVSADDYFLLPINYNSLTEQDQKSYTWTLKDYNYPNDWASNYTPVYNSNYCIEEIEKNERTILNAENWDNVKGSALFFRAFYFTNLVWEYSKAYDANTASTDLGIVLRTKSNFNLPSKRASVEQTYNQIIEDFKAASTYLKEFPIHTMRPSKAAAYSGLARVYLSMRNYDSAFKYSNLSLQIKNTLIDYNNSSIVNPSSNVPFSPFNEEIIFYTTESFNFNVKSPFFAKVDTALYSSYADNDNRKTIFFRPASGYNRFKGSYSANQITLFSGMAVDEMVLIRAECNARVGHLTEAMSDLNSLLIKRWVTGLFTPVIITTQMQAIDVILKERRKELLMRGLRWIDIKRLNKEGLNVELKRFINGGLIILAPNDKRFALPIPKDIIELSGIEQN